MSSEEQKKLYAHLPEQPGVYLMRNAQGVVIYVGKAKNLKRRVSSYFLKHHPDAKTRALVRTIRSIEVMLTQHETEALLLENNFIKQHHPRFNVIFRDDKSYPYIVIQKGHAYPSVGYFRGRRKEGKEYFGPYLDREAVTQTLDVLFRVFQLRHCDDTSFAHRTRPCLQHQIGRCSAPCVGMIDPETYKDQLAKARAFLKGGRPSLIQQWMKEMNEASENMAFEKAARLRDQIAALRVTQVQQSVVTSVECNMDVIAVAMAEDLGALQCFKVRQGELIAQVRQEWRDLLEGESASALVHAFLREHYLHASEAEHVPPVLVFQEDIEDLELWSELLSQELNITIVLKKARTLEEKNVLQLSLENAREILAHRMQVDRIFYQKFEALQRLLKLERLPKRIAGFDISHQHGEATRASCVVYDLKGPVRRLRRCFKIEDIIPGDDYAAMHQAVKKAIEHWNKREEILPEVLLIDGGLGQWRSAYQAAMEEDFKGLIWSLAKDTDRTLGQERLIDADHPKGRSFPAEDVGFRLLLAIRDEAHDTAIKASRRENRREHLTSPLKKIEGIGKKRHMALLQYFGSLSKLREASVEEIARVPFFSRSLAEKVVEALRS